MTHSLELLRQQEEKNDLVSNFNNYSAKRYLLIFVKCLNEYKYYHMLGAYF